MVHEVIAARPRSPRERGWLSWPARVADSARHGPLAVRNFRLLSVGLSTSTVGDYCYAVALPWLILSGHGGTVLLGTVLACYGIPRTILIPLGGVLADKLGPRTVMLAADTCRCALMCLLAVLAAERTDPLVALAPIAALLGAGEGMFLPASFSIMPTLLPAEQLATGNAFSTALMQIGSLTGPVLGGLLVAPAGPSPAFAVDAATFGASAAALALIRVERERPTGGERTVPEPTVPEPTVPAAPTPEPSGPELGGPELGGPELGGLEFGGLEFGEQDRGPSTWQLLRRSRLLRIILAVAVAANVTAGGTFEVAMPALAHARYGASGFGTLLASFGAGAVIGTLIGSRMGALRRPAIVACSGFVVEGAALCLLPLSGGLAGAASALMVAGVCNGFGNIVLFTLIQQRAPAQSLGRVMSLLMVAGVGSFPVSVGMAGWLVRHLHATAFFPLAGVALGLAVLAALCRREMREFGPIR
ncbi:MAG TPA: MFS transporter [Streptosporangiaceae bacterium]|nr:MFS transporter [Streptosporangiaceae bacterium]